MVILIGAESSTGKTLMAQKLLELYKIPYLSADHIKMGIYRANINCGFYPNDSNEIIEKQLWPILKGIIETNIENNQSIIIEGCYIFPNRINEFANEYKAQIIPVFMGFSKEYLENNFSCGVLKHRCAIEMREEEERTVDWFITANERFKALCIKYAVRYFEIQNNYCEDTAVIYEWVADEVEHLKSGNYMV